VSVRLSVYSVLLSVKNIKKYQAIFEVLVTNAVKLVINGKHNALQELETSLPKKYLA
jgi:hypothetical protein